MSHVYLSNNRYLRDKMLNGIPFAASDLFLLELCLIYSLNLTDIFFVINDYDDIRYIYSYNIFIFSRGPQLISECIT